MLYFPPTVHTESLHADMPWCYILANQFIYINFQRKKENIYSIPKDNHRAQRKLCGYIPAATVACREGKNINFSEKENYIFPAIS